MNENKILHVMILSNFLAPFIDFVDENFGRENHHYVFITSEKYEYGLTPEHKVEFLHTDDDIFITLLKYMKMAKKIILHGLWRDKVDVLLYFNQKILKKCYFFMWGGDFYFPEKQTWFRHQIIKNIGNLVTDISLDLKYIREKYGSIGNHIKLSFVYPNSLYHEYKSEKTSNDINILVGNSATKTNNHYEILTKLSIYRDKNICIYIPLSYGDKIYAQEIKSKSQEIFGNKFIDLNNFIDLNEYIKLLSKIDIAIFNHERQQAFNSIITLIGLGKKVYLNPSSPIIETLNEYKVCFFTTDNINLDPLDNINAKKNIDRIKKLFSKEILIKNLDYIFNSKEY